jgi:hypothetical protein
MNIRAWEASEKVRERRRLEEAPEGLIGRTGTQRIAITAD